MFWLGALDLLIANRGEMANDTEKKRRSNSLQINDKKHSRSNR